MSKINKKHIAYIIIVAIFIFAVGIRLYWASRQDDMHTDEVVSAWISNGNTHYWQDLSPLESKYNPIVQGMEYNKIYTGEEIKRIFFYNDSSIKDCFKDILKIYRSTGDAFISNFYYSFLRLAFIGRTAYNIENIIMTGTILNCLFFAISFIFMYKLLRMFFKDNYPIVIFGLLCISLAPSSITFAMFLRPYQMQETFFIVFSFIVSYIVLKKKYSIKNFIILTLIIGMGYLALSSSVLFVLCMSLAIFIYYLINEKEEVINILNNIACYRKSFLTIASPYIKSLLIVSTIFILFFAIITPLGIKTRYAYLEIENEELIPLTMKKITTKIKYESKVFRHSDIYSVFYVGINNDRLLSYNVRDTARVEIYTDKNFDNNELKNIKVEYRLKPKIYKMVPIIFYIFIISIFIPFIKNYKIVMNDKKKMLFYFALSFLFAFLIAQLLYANFMAVLFTSNNRARDNVSISIHTYDFLNKYAFVGILSPILIILIVSFIMVIKLYGINSLKQSIKNNLLLILTIFGALIAAFISDMLTPKVVRYSLTPYPIILIVLPLSVFILIKNEKLKYIFMIIISVLYIQSSITGKGLEYLEIGHSSKEVMIFKQKPELTVYGLENLLKDYFSFHLYNSQNYVLIKDFDSLMSRIDTDNPNGFYTILIGDRPSIKKAIELKGYSIVNKSSVGVYEIVEFARN